MFNLPPRPEYFGPEHQAFRQTVRDFVTREIAPHVSARVLADAPGGGVVALAAGQDLLLWATGWTWLDPVVSLIVSATILLSAWSLLRESLELALDAVPDHIDPEAVRRYLAELPGVTEVHDLHIWAMSTTETALTAHLVMPSSPCAAHFLGSVCKDLHQRFRIDHPTLQVEPADAPDRCRQAAEEAV